MDLEQILLQINELKGKMGALWDKRRKTDPEILELSEEIDNLLNQYYQLVDRKIILGYLSIDF